MKDKLYKQYWDQLLKYEAQHKTILKFIAEYGP